MHATGGMSKGANMGEFNGELSRRIDVYMAAIQTVETWPDSCVKSRALLVLHYRLHKLEQAAGL